MKLEQIYTGCLSEAAYYIESDGEAAIVDPLRDPKPYLERARADHARIKYVFETHFHADFVSGHLDLAQKTGAEIVFGPTARPSYPAHIGVDEEIFLIGKLKIKLLHTPGHTMESSCFLLYDEAGKEYALFSGDTLFVGDVGRPDLVQKLKPEITPQILAGYLYDSIRNKIMPLPDEVILYPGHGAGSACGKKIDKETRSTIGKQKKLNYALNPQLNRSQFIKEVLTGLVEPPAYFPGNVLMNIQGVPSFDEVIKHGLHPLDMNSFRYAWENSAAIVIDTRTKEEFARQHIPGTLFIGIDDAFAPWAGTLIPDLGHPLLIICKPGREEEVLNRLSRVGFDNTLGYLNDSPDTWANAGLKTESIPEITAEEFAESFKKQAWLNLLDVRRESEFKSEHLLGAKNFPLDFIYANLPTLDPTKTYYLHCAGGYRSMIAASILKMKGFRHIINIAGGYRALSRTHLQHTAHLELNTEL